MCDYQICQVIRSSSEMNICMEKGCWRFTFHKSGPQSRAGSQPRGQLCLTLQRVRSPSTHLPFLFFLLFFQAYAVASPWSSLQPHLSLWCPPVFFPFLSLTQCLLAPALSLIAMYIHKPHSPSPSVVSGGSMKRVIYPVDILILLWMTLQWIPSNVLVSQCVDLRTPWPPPFTPVCNHGYILTLIITQGLLIFKILHFLMTASYVLSSLIPLCFLLNIKRRSPGPYHFRFLTTYLPPACSLPFLPGWDPLIHHVKHLPAATSLVVLLSFIHSLTRSFMDPMRCYWAPTMCQAQRWLLERLW